MPEPKIDYPCEWSYRIVGSDEESIRGAVSQHLEGTDYTLALANTSRTGKYVSLNLAVVVEDEETRKSILEYLIGLSSVKIVV